MRQRGKTFSTSSCNRLLPLSTQPSPFSTLRSTTDPVQPLQRLPTPPSKFDSTPGIISRSSLSFVRRRTTFFDASTTRLPLPRSFDPCPPHLSGLTRRTQQAPSERELSSIFLRHSKSSNPRSRKRSRHPSSWPSSSSFKRTSEHLVFRSWSRSRRGRRAGSEASPSPRRRRRSKPPSPNPSPRSKNLPSRNSTRLLFNSGEPTPVETLDHRRIG